MSQNRFKPIPPEQLKALADLVKQQYQGQGLFEKQNSVLYSEIVRKLNIGNEAEETKHSPKSR